MAESEQTPAGESNRGIAFSQAFKAFINEDWAPSPSDIDPANLPAQLPAAPWAAKRRAALSAAFPGELLVLPAGPLKPRNNDCDYRFRPHTAFAYESGLGEDKEPDAMLALIPAADGHQAVLFFHPRVPRTDPEFYADARYGELWVGQRESLAEMAALTGLETRDITEFDAIIGDGDARIVRDADEPFTAKVDALRTAAGSDVEAAKGKDEELARWLSEARLVKDEFEIGQMREACRRTATAFAAVVADFPQAVRRGRGERWVEGVFGLHARHLGNATGYDSIVAADDHATTLHWIRNTGELRPESLLLIDAGIEIESLYTADITRTLPLSGRYSPAQRQVYEAVLEAQQAGIDAAKPGNKFKDIHLAAIAVIARYLEQWGLLPVSAAAALDLENGQHFRRWMVHGTSHHLGIDVHDCALARDENYKEAELRPGMVCTVEPGLYFKAADLKVPPELRGIGVRIEDDIVITETGCEILSRDLPRHPDEVEAWMRQVWEWPPAGATD
ncbi:MAG: aminopeptidase P family protein [Propionibacteriaceae bacterium]|jgi:Xaa-Pro aminopeptidase|nr:aminopeptidase P family protein [Propionibacteriaceae bacterium]